MTNLEHFSEGFNLKSVMSKYNEKISYLIQARGSLTQDELSPAEKQALTGEDDQQKITTYEQAMKYMKDATGVSDTKVNHTT